MKKNKLKNYLKLGIFLFGITFVPVNCQKDDMLTDRITETKSPFSIKYIEKIEISENSLVKEQLEKFNTENTSISNRDVYNSQYNFTVDTDYSKYVESTDGSFHSYTLP